MTIAAGFRCANGVVLAADSQYTQQYTTFGLKTQGPKLFTIADRKDLAVIAAGAGNVPFMKMAADKLEIGLEHLISPSESDVKSKIESVLVDFFKTHVYPVPNHKQPDFRLLIGIRTDTRGQSNPYTLWETTLTSLTKVDDCQCIGIGNTVSNYALAITSHPYFVEDAKVRAAFCVSAAKEHVNGCGGKTNIWALTSEGIDRVSKSEVGLAEEYGQKVTEWIQLCLNLLDPDSILNTDSDVDSIAHEIRDKLAEFRSEIRERREKDRKTKEKRRLAKLARESSVATPPALGSQ